MLNIGGDARDASYRYKMPPLVTKIEGRGNGIKTVLVNMVDVAKALHIHAAYPTKFFGIELGAQSKYDAKSERAIVNGAHQSGDLAKLLEKFIHQFILCPTCKLPEITMKVGSRDIKITCAACGHSSVLNTPHKLAGYVLKNPPSSFGEDKEKGKKKKKEKDLDDDDGEKTHEDVDKHKEEEDVEEDEESEKKEKKKKKKDKEKSEKDDADKPKKEKKDKKEKKKKKKDDGESSDSDADVEAPAPKPKSKSSKKSIDEEDTWHTDTSKEAQAARKEAELAEMKSGIKDASKLAEIEKIQEAAKADNKTESPVTTLKLFLAAAERKPAEIIGQLKLLQLSRALDEPNKIKVLLEALIDASNITNAKALTSQLQKHAPTLRLVANDKMSSTVFVNVIEDYVGSTNPKFLSYIPHVLQTLYESDVLEEDVIISWYDSPPEASYLVNKDVAANVRSKAKPFVNWLKEADEDGDD